MIGVGPFLTIPLLLQAMQGPQAMLGWLVGAVIALADGLVWAELGAAMPQSGGGYHYLLQAYGPRGPGRLMSFLYLWSIVITGPLYVASGSIGFSQYATYLHPAMTAWQAKLLAMGVCLLSTLLIYRRIDRVGRWGLVFSFAVLAAVAWIIAEGVLHAHVEPLALPANAFHLSSGFWYGLGGATLYATYDYAGYNTVCLVGGEVVRPEVTIPRSVVTAIAIVCVLYLSMNFAIIGAMPWHEAAQSKYVVSDFIARLQGHGAASLMTILILAVTLASVFGVMLGNSRIPYAAAADGRFFKAFARLHPIANFPSFSVLFTGFASMACCLLDLDAVIKLVTVAAIILGSLSTVAAPTLLRRARPDIRLPFRMWLYPLPSIVAAAGRNDVDPSGGGYDARQRIALYQARLLVVPKDHGTNKWPAQHAKLHHFHQRRSLHRRGNWDPGSRNRSVALYQGTTLVVPKTAEKNRALAPAKWPTHHAQHSIISTNGAVYIVVGIGVLAAGIAA